MSNSNYNPGPFKGKGALKWQLISGGAVLVVMALFFLVAWLTDPSAFKSDSGAVTTTSTSIQASIAAQ